MAYQRTPSKMILRIVAGMLLFASLSAAQIAGLCNTGETRVTASGCTGVLVTPNPPGGGSDTDGNWQLASPYPSALSPTVGPCSLTYIAAWVDTPNPAWLVNSASSASEWITPFDGEDNVAFGWYVYRTKFPVPLVLPGGGAPTGLTINGRLASDNATYAIFLQNPARTQCDVVNLPIPINPAGAGDSDFQQWWDFSFTNPAPITPGTAAYLYIAVRNADNTGGSGPSPTGLRLEFFDTSSFQ